VAGVTIVRAESDVGLPKGPRSSATVIRPATCTASLRMPAYSSPSRPSRIITVPTMYEASYNPYGSWNSSEHQLITSTIELMRGSASPLRTRRKSASFDGRVLVGSMPTRLYIVRTAADSAGGDTRTRDSASASSGSSPASRSTPVAPLHQIAPARTIAASSGEIVRLELLSFPAID